VEGRTEVRVVDPLAESVSSKDGDEQIASSFRNRTTDANPKMSPKKHGEMEEVKDIAEQDGVGTTQYGATEEQIASDWNVTENSTEGSKCNQDCVQVTSKNTSRYSKKKRSKQYGPMPKTIGRTDQVEGHCSETILEAKHRLASRGGNRASARGPDTISTAVLHTKSKNAQRGMVLAAMRETDAVPNHWAESDTLCAKRADITQRFQEGSIDFLSPGAHRVGGLERSEENQSSTTQSVDPEVLVAATLVEDTAAFAEPLQTNLWVRLAFIATIMVVLITAVVSGVMILEKDGTDAISDEVSDEVSDLVMTPILTGRWNPLDDPVRGATGDAFLGASVAISVDGNIFAAGAPGSHVLSGSINVFRRSNKGNFERMGDQIELRGATPGDMLGFSVALSRDGLTVAGGAIAFGEVSDNLGYVKVARYNETVQAWQLLGEPIPGEVIGESFGNSVDLSDDGNIVVIGAPFNNNNGFESGQVKVFLYTGVRWEPLGDVQQGDNVGDEFGKHIKPPIDIRSPLSLDANIGSCNRDECGYQRRRDYPCSRSPPISS